MTPAQQEAALEEPRSFTGAQSVIACLEFQEVEVIFGMTGGAIMPVYDAMYHRQKIRHVIVGHEQGAAHMADGYARVTGKPGVVMTTSGPGATNLVTGLANAMMDSIPMVAITGQVSSTMLGSDVFQEADMWGITLPVTKHNYQVTDPEELPHVITEAFFLAQSGRPGPVLIDLPKDVMLANCSSALAVPQAPEGYNIPYRGDPQQVAHALSMIRRAKRPVIMAGGGVINAGASQELTQLAEALGAPVTTTLMGMGAFPARHELALGMPGMHGTPYANMAIHDSDLLLCVGVRLDDRVTGKVAEFAPQATLIHVDIDASEINKIMPAAEGIVGDALPVLRDLLAGVRSWPQPPELGPWRERIKGFKAANPMVYPNRPGIIAPQAAVEILGGLLDESATVVTGVGQHQMYTAQYYPFTRPRSFLTSGGLGTMGYGLPAAIGARVGQPQGQVVCIDGDGSFLMNVQELATAARYGLGLVVMVLNNGYLGMVRQWQDRFHDGRRSETKLQPPRYDKVSQAFGGLGRRVEKMEELEPALQWALAAADKQNLPVVLDVMVDTEAEVLPMVPAGAANVDFIACEKETCDE